ncbi:MAG: peptidase M48 Ste24p [Gemmatimonadetes bacterium]|nr:MAG: peptidase M48 Ste24p [Gemmatimonadota bacterium]
MRRRASARVAGFALAGLLTLVLPGCSVSEDQEVELGRRNAEQVDAQLPVVRDPVASNYVQALGTSIARTTERSDLDWRFRIIDSRQVNAFALPGGFIYVNRGLIERAEGLDELAGVLAHEVGHVVLRHSVHQIEKQNKTGVAVELGCRLTNLCNSDVARAAIQVGGAALFARYSRHDEAEADSEAVRLVVNAGIDPTGIPTMFRRLLEERRTSPLGIEAFFASHPLEEDRIVATEHEIAAVPPSALRGLRRDDPSYQAFKAHLAWLPRAPEPEPNAVSP